MKNRMSIEKLATNIMKRAVAAEHIQGAYSQKQNEINIIDDFIELADRLGYRVVNVEELA